MVKVSYADGSTEEFKTLQEAFDSVQSAGTQATFTMLGDVTESVTMDNGDITLDLAGHTITGNGGTVLTINTSSNENVPNTLTLEDSAASTADDGGGKITGGAPDSAGSSGGGVLVQERSLFIMKGGTISGNTGSSGAGVYLNGAGVGFEMDGGAITGNTSTDSGGGVRVANSSNDTGGAILP